MPRSASDIRRRGTPHEVLPTSPIEDRTIPLSVTGD
jgi:hypothetical protein